MDISTQRKGELFLFSEAFLWSFFPIITILSLNLLSPLYSLALSSLIAAIFFAIWITYKQKWSEFKIKKAIKYMFLTTLFIGIIFYSLIFVGLQYTTAGNASIILLMEVFFAMVILNGWKKEKLSPKLFFGAFFMVIGALLILFQGSFSINKGDLILLVATAVPTLGNYYAQQARQYVSSSTIMLFRSVVSGVFLLVFAAIIEPQVSISVIRSSLWFLLINGILLLGVSKLLWIEAIHRISITKAISLQSIVPAFTLVFAYFILQEIPTLWQILGLIPIFTGVVMLVNK